MPNAATLESLTIEINGNASSASSGITSLIAPLRSLARSVGTVLPALKELNVQMKKLSGIGNIKIPSLTPGGSSGTNGIKARTKAVHEAVTELKNFKDMTPAQMQAWRDSDAPIMKEYKGMTPAKWNSWRYSPYQLPKVSDYRNNQASSTALPASERHPESYLSREEWERGADANRASIIAREAKSAVREITHDVAKQVTQSKPIAVPATLKNTTGTPAGFKPVDPTLAARSEEMLAKQAAREAERAAMRAEASKIQFPSPSEAKSVNISSQLKATADAASGATSGIKKVTESLNSSASASKAATSALKGVDKELRQKKTDGNTANTGLTAAASGARDAGDSAKKAKPLLEGFGKGLSRLGRIAKTMLIRTALRALMKAFGESWQAAYAFSNAMDGSFAKSVDQAKTLLADTTTSIIQAFAPAFEAMVPILYVVANAIQYLCQGIIYLMSLLGMTSDVAGASTQKVNKYYGASSKGAKGAAKDNKNLLASWDELNIIQSKNSSGGSSGGGSGYKPGSLKDLVSDEMSAVTAIIVGEALLAVGLILTCTGHFGIGIGLMAIGAASIAKTLIADWGKLPKQVKKSIAEIMTIAGTAMLALGVILACTGHLGIGIGLIALGIANIAGIVAASWDDELETGVKQTITKITAIAGGSMLALGIILACCGMLPMGIGLIVAGVGSLGVAVGLNWGSIVNTVNSVMTDISNWFVEKWEAIKTAVSNAWDEVSKWWDKNIAKPVEEAWNSVSAFFAKLFAGSDTEGSIAYYAKIGWDAITYWWDTNIATPFTESWDLVKDYFKLLFSGDKTKEGSIAYFADKAWASISTWWTNIKDTFSKAWDDVVTYFRDDVWGSTEQGGTIVGTVWDAWQTVETWWTGIYDLVSGAWDSVKTFFKELWIGADGNGGIAGWISGAWDSVVHFWKDDIWGSITAAWEGIGKFFSELFAPIREAWEYLQKILAFNKEKGVSPVTPGYNFFKHDGQTTFIGGFAGGGYDIPSGELFIANEAGAELVGTMNGKTTVANQTQIIEGIQAGVYAAQSDQNELLRRQNDLLTELINKSGDIRVTPSAEWGKFNQRSGEMWNRVSGR